MNTKKDSAWIGYYEKRTSRGADFYGKDEVDGTKIIRILGINKKDSVFDIGCATGNYLTDIQKKTGARCSGIDISPLAVKMNKNKKLKLKVGDMRKIPFEDNSFTKIFSLGTVEHVPETDLVFREINRVLKQGGRIYITVPNKLSFFHITKKIKMVLGIWDKEIGYEKSFTKSEIRAILGRAGFELTDYWVDPHRRISNVFNLKDNILNRINRRRFGFFVNFVARKVMEIKRLK